MEKEDIVVGTGTMTILRLYTTYKRNRKTKTTTDMKITTTTEIGTTWRRRNGRRKMTTTMT